MAAAEASHGARILLFTYLAALIGLARCGNVYYYTGAYYIQGHNGGSWAVQAQCPAGNPVSCSSIQEPDYCCPTNNYCAWADNKIACCPNGCSCTGWSGTYQPTSYYAPQPSSTRRYWRPSSTHYWQPQSTYVAPAAYTPVQSTPAAVGYGQYCSTLYAHGPNLPTTAQGDCGIILVVNPDQQPPPPSEGSRNGMGYLRLAIMIGVLQVFGGVLFAWR